MARIAFCVCGFLTDGSAASIAPLNGWFWLQEPTAAPDILPSMDFPIIYSAADGVLLAWRIQTLTLTWDITFTPDGESPQEFSGTQSGNIESGAVDLSDETDLVNVVGDTEFLLQNLETGNATLEIFMFRMCLDAEGNLYIATSLTFSTGVIGLSIYPDPDGEESGISITSSSIPSFDGVPLYCSSPPGGSYSGTVSIEATSYWAYDNGLSPPPSTNGPVFDTTTGAQLITPAPGGL